MGNWETDSLVGKRLGQFDIKSELGRGGMAVVYKGYQQSLDRWVAIKTLPKEFSGNRDMVSRFHREAEAMVALNHTNIVQIIDKGEDQGLYYFAMEFVEGPSLKELLKNEELSMDLLFDVAQQVCDGLAYAHKKGIVHRDIKPANVFWETSTSLAKIGDFGIARLTEKPLEMITLTAANVGMGTMNYMAPEQKTDAGGVDHRADIYSTGVMIYEMFTGKLPMGRFKMPSQLNSGLPRKLDELVAKCLEADPEDRFGDMGTVRQELAAARESAKGGTLVRSVRDAAERTLTAVASGGGGGGKLIAGCLVVAMLLGTGGAAAFKFLYLDRQVASGGGGTDGTETGNGGTDGTNGGTNGTNGGDGGTDTSDGGTDTSDGGTDTGGTDTGGTDTGGTDTGGTDTGGTDTGGADTGGTDTGGTDTGGTDTGGTDTGGADTGGTDTGGADTGGTDTGGTDTGGTDTGGTNGGTGTGDGSETGDTGTVKTVPNPAAERKQLKQALADHKAAAVTWELIKPLGAAFASAEKTLKESATPDLSTAGVLTGAHSELLTKVLSVFAGSVAERTRETARSRAESVRTASEAAHDQLKGAVRLEPSKQLSAYVGALKALVDAEIVALISRQEAAAELARVRVPASALEGPQATLRQAAAERSPLKAKRLYQRAVDETLALKGSVPTRLEPLGQTFAHQLTQDWGATFAAVAPAAGGRFGLLTRNVSGQSRIYVVSVDAQGFGGTIAVDVMPRAQFLASAGQDANGVDAFWVCAPTVNASEIVKYRFTKDGTLLENRAFWREIRELVYAMATGPDGRLYLATRNRVMVLGEEGETALAPVSISRNLDGRGALPRSLTVLRDGWFVLSGLRKGSSLRDEENWPFMIGEWDETGRAGLSDVQPQRVNPAALAVVGGKLIAAGHSNKGGEAEIAVFESALTDATSVLSDPPVSARPFRALGIAVSDVHCVVLDIRPFGKHVGRADAEQAKKLVPELNLLRRRALLYTLR